VPCEIEPYLSHLDPTEEPRAPRNGKTTIAGGDQGFFGCAESAGETTILGCIRPLV
jgi:hypothetical protein